MIHSIENLEMNYLVGIVVHYVYTIREEFPIFDIKRVLQVYLSCILILKKSFDFMKSGDLITKSLVQLI